MIDIHHHCLPGVDDGPREWDEAVAMCRMAADEGIEAIVATPHVLRGRWRSWTAAELKAQFAELQSRVGTRPRLLLGSEYFFAHDMVEQLSDGTAIVPLAGSRYVLIELVASNVPPLIEQPLYRAQLEGWIPVLAHPERNIALQHKPELLEELIDHGVKVQLTASSLTGDFGKAAKQSAEHFLDARMVHFVATDAHDTTKRPPRVRAAAEALRARVGDAVTHALMVDNPRAVVENRPLPYDPEPAGRRQDGLLTRLGAFFSGRRP